MVSRMISSLYSLFSRALTRVLAILVMVVSVNFGFTWTMAVIMQSDVMALASFMFNSRLCTIVTSVVISKAGVRTIVL